MDPFEARLQFIKLLQRLNASVQAIDNVLDFLKMNRGLEEDLYSCILQELSTNSLNVSLNIFYFLESLVEHCYLDKNFLPGSHFMEYIGRDIVQIFNKVVPSGRIGLVNLSAAKEVIENISKKVKLSQETLTELNRAVESRSVNIQASPENQNAKSTESHGQTTNVTSSVVTPNTATLSAGPPDSSGSGPGSGGSGLGNNETGLKRADILRRMDEDRERHKRLKENIWAIDYSKNLDMEFENTWETVGGVKEFDNDRMDEENGIWKASIGLS